MTGASASGRSFERIADRYDDSRGGDDRGAFVAARLRPWLAEGPGVVEIGVGTGLVAAALAGLGVPVVGLDLSPAMLARARRRIGPRLAVADALRLPLRAGTVGTAYFVHVLHLVADLEGTLVEAARALRRPGRLLVVSAAGRPPADAMEELVAGLRLRLHGPRPDLPDRVVAAGHTAGLRLRHQQWLARAVETSPSRVAAAIEGRLWAWTWDLPERTWRDEVRPVVDALRGLPDAERPRPVDEDRALIVFDAVDGTA